ncbi:MAG TPA: hypothetical protein PJ997_01500 [Candidatus Paceibacterota bacterium]|nr:hypothetical protein [Candidatus Paceibacterota bacterium]HMP18994.1 hypothetical protein [Candidatus Paceibacterota bacterium]HMP85231.1 hypothetical protein [Candidatus Paceibacterota bacterium]
MKKYFTPISIIIILVIFLIPILSYSQMGDFEVENMFSDFNQLENVFLEINPPFPAPNQTVKASVTSYTTDLKKQLITWMLNDVKYREGIGLTHIDLELGNSGSRNVIKVIVTKQNLSEIQAEKIITPQNLSIVAEAQTYVPAFYRGKALASSQSNYKFIAVTDFKDQNGNKIPSKDLVFRWEINDKRDAENSGPGKDTYYYTNNIISRPVRVVLEVSPLNSQNSAKTSRTFGFTDPIILFYESNPVFGTILDRAIFGEITMLTQELNIISEPYFFEKNSIKNLKSEWFMDSKPVQTQNKNSLTLRRTDEKAGQVQISHKLSNPNMLMQYNNSNLLVKFNKQ